MSPPLRLASRTRFQSQTRSRPGCHALPTQPATPTTGVSISNEKPPRLPRHRYIVACRQYARFQSQTRSRPGCHTSSPASRRPCHSGFNLKREAAPVATLMAPSNVGPQTAVSISNEKPPRLPLDKLRRSRLHGQVVSISNEKPPRLPLEQRMAPGPRRQSFNLKREAAPVATAQRVRPAFLQYKFQSQTRSRPGCHTAAYVGASISTGFNLKREAAPVATCPRRASPRRGKRVSISNEKPPRLPRRSPGRSVACRSVSISNEKPPRLPLRLPRAASGAAGRLHLRGRWFWVL